MAVRGLGCPVRFTLTAARRAMHRKPPLIEGLPAEVVMADTAYDADHLRQAIAAKGAWPSSQQPVTRAEISARQAPLCPAPSGGMLLLKAQAVPPRRTASKRPPKLHCRRHLRFMDGGATA